MDAAQMTLDFTQDAPRRSMQRRVRRMVTRTAKCKKLEDVRDLQAGFIFDPCACGKIPTMREVHSWPAQYQIECECGNYALGRYWAYGEDDGTMRHLRSSLDALHRWNRTKEIENIHEEKAWLDSVRRSSANTKARDRSEGELPPKSKDPES